MKQVIPFVIIVLVLVGCATTKSRGTEEDFESMSMDICECVNKSTEQLSPEMRHILDNFGGDKGKMQEMMAAYASENPTQAMEDANMLQGAVINDFSSCIEGVEEKYANVYTDMSSEEILRKLVLILKEKEDCQSSYGLMRMSQN